MGGKGVATEKEREVEKEGAQGSSFKERNEESKGEIGGSGSWGANYFAQQRIEGQCRSAGVN